MSIGPVLLVDLARGFGGAEARVIDTALLLGSDVECGVAVLSDSPLHHRAETAGVVVRPLNRGRGDPRMVGALRQVIRAHGYQVVDAHNVQSQIWGHLAARAEGVPNLVSTVHSEYREENRGLKGRMHEQVLRRNGSWGCNFVAVGDGIARYLRSVVGPDARIDLIRRGFPVPIPPSSITIHRSELGWGQREPVVGVIGRLAPAKGHTVLLEALRRLKDRGLTLRCYILGEGHQRGALERQVRDSSLSDMVHFAGFRDDVGSVMTLIDFLCLPSLTEGLPNVILEAVTCRVPLVVSSVGEIPDLLRDEIDALLVPPNDPPALAIALERAMAAPEEGRRRADAAYSSLTASLGDNWIEQTKAVYARPFRASPTELS